MFARRRCTLQSASDWSKIDVLYGVDEFTRLTTTLAVDSVSQTVDQFIRCPVIIINNTLLNYISLHCTFALASSAGIL